MNELHPVFQQALRPFAPPLSSLHQRGESSAPGNAGHSKDQDGRPTDSDLYEARAWRGCLGDRTL